MKRPRTPLNIPSSRRITSLMVDFLGKRSVCVSDAGCREILTSLERVGAVACNEILAELGKCLTRLRVNLDLSE